MSSIGPSSWLTFVRQVRFEIQKISWPSRQEVVLSSIFVFVMVTLFSIFFIAVDSVLATAIGWLLK